MAPDHYHHLVHKLSDLDSIIPNAGVSASVLAVIATGSIATIVQAVTPAADISWIEHLTLEGALVVAVIVLWRALGVKDARIEAQNEQLMASNRASTEALSAFTASNSELRRTIEHLNEAARIIR